MRTLRLALAQTNPIVGDLSGNFNKVVSFVHKGIEADADIIAFPELALCGYPPEDLLLRPEFVEDNLAMLHKLVPLSKEITIVIGYVERDDDIYNAAAILHRGKLVDTYRKHFLPNYSVFDENRYFQSGSKLPVYHLNNIRIGVNICEDIWYPGGPTNYQALNGDAEIIINISASPYTKDRIEDRNRMLAVRASDNNIILAYVNQVGGQDELLFDGTSVIYSEEGELISRAPSFEEALLVADLHPDNVFGQRLRDPRRRKSKLFSASHVHIDQIQLSDNPKNNRTEVGPPQIAASLTSESEVYTALVLGVRDYIKKNGFSKVLVGLSGGIDSSLVCAVAADAIGGKNVIGIAMPSQYTSDASNEDAAKLAENFGIEFYTMPIGEIHDTFLNTLAPAFTDLPPDVTEENIQARVRGNILMAFSNKFGALVLTTGNKSEFSCGYCTLYGDMAGGYAVIKDVYKTNVYTLCRYRNELADYDIIPENVLTKAPTAELRPNQKDTDSLPPYEVLDPIIKAYVEYDRSVDEIVSQGFDLDIVQKVIRMITGNEYKRRQGAPGIRITARAFGKDRRFPITNGYRV